MGITIPLYCTENTLVCPTYSLSTPPFPTQYIIHIHNLNFQSPSSITTRVLLSEKQEAVQSPSSASATTGDLRSEQQETVQSSSSVSTRDEQTKQEKTIFFGEYPIKIVCPKCNKEMVTKITFKIGSLTWILVMALFCTFWLTL